MKKTVVALLAFIFAAVAIFSACNKAGDSSLPANHRSTSSTLRSANDPQISFETAGALHNTLLTYITDNLTGNETESYETLENRAKNLGNDYLGGVDNCFRRTLE